MRESDSGLKKKNGHGVPSGQNSKNSLGTQSNKKKKKKIDKKQPEPTGSKKSAKDRKLPEAYNIKEQIRVVKALKIPARVAVAWDGGWDLRFHIEQEGAWDYDGLIRDAAEVSKLWLKGEGLDRGCYPPRRRPVCVRCVAYRLGDTWHVWEDAKVRSVVNPSVERLFPADPESPPPDDRLSFHLAAFRMPGCEPRLGPIKGCIKLLHEILDETAELYCAARQRPGLQNFARLFGDPKIDDFKPGPERELALLLHRAKSETVDTIQRLERLLKPEESGVTSHADSLDRDRALRPPFMLGLGLHLRRMLDTAWAILRFAKFTGMMVQQGSGRGQAGLENRSWKHSNTSM